MNRLTEKLIYCIVICLEFAILTQQLANKIVDASSASQISMGVLGSANQIPAGTLWYGIGCSGASSNTCTVGGTYTGGLSTLTTGQSFTMGSHVGGYTARSCGINFGATGTTPNNKYRCGIYTVSGTTATIVVNCAQTSDQVVGAVPGWTTSSMPPGCILAASTTYLVYVEVNSDSTTVANNASGGSGNFYKTGWTYGTFTSPITGLTSNAGIVSSFVVVTPN